MTIVLSSHPMRTKAFILGILAMVGYSFYTMESSAMLIKPYVNGVFPDQTPGGLGDFEVEAPFELLTIPSPLKLVPLAGTQDYLVLNKIGEVYRASFTDQTQKMVLDIKDRCFKLGDGGSVGIALHPRFGFDDSKKELYIYYRYKPNPDEWSDLGYNRLSKFYWNAAEGAFDSSSEEILIQQYDRSVWHNGGGMSFGKDGFLYLAVGDEGADDHQIGSTQTISGGFFSGVLRIDVDRDSTRSHPIRRHPKSLGEEPTGWPQTFSDGYYIPNDNPWNSQDGTVLEEFYSVGMRSPFNMYIDSVEQKMWVTDVGSDKFEEVNILSKKSNGQWPYKEGSYSSDRHHKPDPLLGDELTPIVEYSRDEGFSIIGGDVYYGDKFPYLNSQYLFGDLITKTIWALQYDEQNARYEKTTLVNTIDGSQLNLPQEFGVSGIHVLESGDIIITILDFDFTKPGAFLRLKAKDPVADPPMMLSELGVFDDLEKLEPIEGIIPYEVNSPLWSDGADKLRWVAVPNDREQRILNKNKSVWEFPAGTVFIKHFEFDSLSTEDKPIRLETRFLVLMDNNEMYGLTYRWNDEGTDAYLLSGNSSRAVPIKQDGTSIDSSYHWLYPNRSQCLSCHNSSASGVLGFKASQLNRAIQTIDNREQNQLEYLQQQLAFQLPFSGGDKLTGLGDTQTDLGERIRSYWDTNCSFCHRPNGVAGLEMDLRMETPLSFQNVISHTTQSHASNPDGLIIRPGDHLQSELWLRDADLGTKRMPPLATTRLDQMYLDSLAKFIDEYESQEGNVSETSVFPNPTSDVLFIQLDDNLSLPAQLHLYNINGQRVSTKALSSRQQTINLNGYQDGVYFLFLESDSQALETFRILKL